MLYSETFRQKTLITPKVGQCLPASSSNHTNHLVRHIYRTCTTHIHDQTTQLLGLTYITFVIILQMAHRATGSSSFVVKAIKKIQLKNDWCRNNKTQCTPPPHPTHPHTQHSTTQHGAYKSKNSDNLLQHKNWGWKLHIHSFPSTCARMHACTQTGTYMDTNRHVCSMHPLILTGRLREGGGGGGGGGGKGGYDWQLKQRI